MKIKGNLINLSYVDNDAYDRMVKNHCESIASKTENLIKKVLPDIPLDEIAKRCEWKSFVHTPKVRFLTLDGVPVLELHDIEFSDKIKEDGSVSIVATQRYRIINSQFANHE
jgi:hypothetical protein